MTFNSNYIDKPFDPETCSKEELEAVIKLLQNKSGYFETK